MHYAKLAYYPQHLAGQISCQAKYANLAVSTHKIWPAKRARYSGKVGMASISKGRPNNIAEIRADRGLTQEELADKANTTVSTIYRLENGKRYLTMDWARRIAAALDCHYAELFGDMSRDEVKLVEIWRTLDAGQRQMLGQMIDGLAPDNDEGDAGIDDGQEPYDPGPRVASG